MGWFNHQPDLNDIEALKHCTFWDFVRWHSVKRQKHGFCEINARGEHITTTSTSSGKTISWYHGFCNVCFFCFIFILSLFIELSSLLNWKLNPSALDKKEYSGSESMFSVLTIFSVISQWNFESIITLTKLQRVSKQHPAHRCERNPFKAGCCVIQRSLKPKTTTT